ncbi:hypothetical protein PPERSA_11329 [Pseudocohnilembus persalinus]|uniref:Uncharacterized protein n=1 Tax=Pseudocohnilembus persalinus TaxID=266149 RepID=A0A0V0QPT2_PSEPJ|nr:hypothetical protein PPERSA_11329 [Pseudocohnilembus persalinus]|eukprot:KRX04205.1 hypothetical protein PPERSA_11329 [Pseudocohnilembus persalinus]
MIKGKKDFILNPQKHLIKSKSPYRNSNKAWNDPNQCYKFMQQQSDDEYDNNSDQLCSQIIEDNLNDDNSQSMNDDTYQNQSQYSHQEQSSHDQSSYLLYQNDFNNYMIQKGQNSNLNQKYKNSYNYNKGNNIKGNENMYAQKTQTNQIFQNKFEQEKKKNILQEQFNKFQNQMSKNSTIKNLKANIKDKKPPKSSFRKKSTSLQKKEKIQINNIQQNQNNFNNQINQKKNIQQLYETDSSLEQSFQQYSSTQQQELINMVVQPKNPNQNQIKLQDLCPEDKQKIGELIKRLAQEKEEKENIKKELQMKEEEYQKQIEKIQNDTKFLLQESGDFQKKYQESIEIIKKLSQEQEKLKKLQSEKQNENLSQKLEEFQKNYGQKFQKKQQLETLQEVTEEYDQSFQQENKNNYKDKPQDVEKLEQFISPITQSSQNKFSNSVNVFQTSYHDSNKQKNEQQNLYKKSMDKSQSIKIHDEEELNSKGQLEYSDGMDSTQRRKNQKNFFDEIGINSPNQSQVWGQQNFKNQQQKQMQKENININDQKSQNVQNNMIITSESEDDLKLAQKWLNLKKQEKKITQSNHDNQYYQRDNSNNSRKQLSGQIITKKMVQDLNRHQNSISPKFNNEKPQDQNENIEYIFKSGEKIDLTQLDEQSQQQLSKLVDHKLSQLKQQQQQQSSEFKEMSFNENSTPFKTFDLSNTKSQIQYNKGVFSSQNQKIDQKFLSDEKTDFQDQRNNQKSQQQIDQKQLIFTNNNSSYRKGFNQQESDRTRTTQFTHNLKNSITNRNMFSPYEMNFSDFNSDQKNINNNSSLISKNKVNTFATDDEETEQKIQDKRKKNQKKSNRSNSYMHNSGQRKLDKQFQNNNMQSQHFSNQQLREHIINKQEKMNKLKEIREKQKKLEDEQQDFNLENFEQNTNLYLSSQNALENSEKNVKEMLKNQIMKMNEKELQQVLLNITQTQDNILSNTKISNTLKTSDLTSRDNTSNKKQIQFNIYNNLLNTDQKQDEFQKDCSQYMQYFRQQQQISQDLEQTDQNSLLQKQQQFQQKQQQEEEIIISEEDKQRQKEQLQSLKQQVEEKIRLLQEKKQQKINKQQQFSQNSMNTDFTSSQSQFSGNKQTQFSGSRGNLKKSLDTTYNNQKFQKSYSKSKEKKLGQSQINYSNDINRKIFNENQQNYLNEGKKIKQNISQGSQFKKSPQQGQNDSYIQNLAEIQNFNQGIESINDSSFDNILNEVQQAQNQNENSNINKKYFSPKQEKQDSQNDQYQQYLQQQYQQQNQLSQKDKQFENSPYQQEQFVASQQNKELFNQNQGQGLQNTQYIQNQMQKSGSGEILKVTQFLNNHQNKNLNGNDQNHQNSNSNFNQFQNNKHQKINRYNNIQQNGFKNQQQLSYRQNQNKDVQKDLNQEDIQQLQEDDFYDDNLFSLVEDLEKEEMEKSNQQINLLEDLNKENSMSFWQNNYNNKSVNKQFINQYDQNNFSSSFNQNDNQYSFNANTGQMLNGFNNPEQQNKQQNAKMFDLSRLQNLVNQKKNQY